MKKFLALLAFTLFPFVAQAQTPGAQPEICVTSPSQTANYNQLCLSASSSGGTVGITNFGSATGGLSFTQNGTVIPTPVRSVFSCLSPAQIADVQARTQSIDLTTTLQTCLTNFGRLAGVFWPAGNYLLSGTLTPPMAQSEVGEALGSNTGTKLVAAAGMSAPFFTLNSSITISGFSFIGSATAGTPNAHCIYVNNTNNTTIQYNFFHGCYSGVYLDGTSFYSTIQNNLFDSNYAYQVWVNSITSSGVDLFINDNRFVGLTATAVAAIRFTGLGSVIMTGNQLSVENPTSELILMDTPAPSFGAAQFTGNVFESEASTAINILGSVSAVWDHLYFVNNIINGGSANALSIQYASDVNVIGGNISSAATTGSIFLSTQAQALNLSLTSVRFDATTGSVSPIQSDSTTVLDYNAINVEWGGAAAVANLSTITGANLTRVNTIGGTASSNATLPASGFNNNVVASNGTLRAGIALGLTAPDVVAASNAGNSIIAVGQDTTHMLQLLWAFNGTPGNAFARIGTFGNANLLQFEASSLQFQINSGLSSVFGGAMISAGTPPTGNTGSCSTGVTVAGGALTGTWTSTSACALAGTIILSALPASTAGYSCFVTDRTTSGVTVEETATSANSATFTVRALPTGSIQVAANDILQYHCFGY